MYEKFKIISCEIQFWNLLFSIRGACYLGYLDFSVNLTYLNRVGHFFRTNNKMLQALASKTHDHPLIVAL